MTRVTRIETPEQLDALMGHGQDISKVRAEAVTWSTEWCQWEVKELNGGLFLQAKIPFVDTDREEMLRGFTKHQGPPAVHEYDLYVEAQPHYSDRGRWLVKVDWDSGGSTLGKEDCWPRYYFVLRNALSEIQSWALARADIRAGIEARKAGKP